MFIYTKQTDVSEFALYKSILLLSRNKLFFTKYNLLDIFQNRIHLIFIHISFLFNKIKDDKKNETYKIFYQKMFDLTFSKIEVNMREIGFGDVTINKNMRFLVKTFYNILLNCEKYKEMNFESKKLFFNKYLQINDATNISINKDLIDYFNKYQAFCFDLSSDSVLRGELNFKF